MSSRSLLCRITKGKAVGCASPLVDRINGQPVKFKALAGFVAGPALVWSALNPASTIARMTAGTVGLLVTVIDGGHVIRHYLAKREAPRVRAGAASLRQLARAR